MPTDAEWSTRKSDHLTRLIRNPGYADSAACENIEYHLARGGVHAQAQGHPRGIPRMAAWCATPRLSCTIFAESMHRSVGV